MIKDITKEIETSFFIPNIVYVLIAGLIVRFILAFFGTLSLDHGTFVAWSINLARNGFSSFYNGWSDYLPGYLYILWLLGKIKLVLPGFPEVLLYKLPGVLSDVATGYLIYRILKEIKGVKWGLIGASLYLFNPAVFANSALWGQVDSLTALFSILSIYFLPMNYLLSAISLSVGTLIKPQAAFILPVIIFLIIKNKWKITKFLAYSLISLVVFVAGFTPFSSGKFFPAFILERLNVSLNQYPYTSVNAFNFWGLFGFWKPDSIYFQWTGYILVIGIFVVMAIKLWQQWKNTEFLLASLIFASSFMFFTRMHERHLLPVFAPLSIIAIENPIFLIPYIGFSLTYIANLYYSYQWITNDFVQVFPEMVLKLFSVLNLGLAVFISIALIKSLHWEWRDISLLTNRFFHGEETTTKEIHFPSVKLSKNIGTIILVLILLFAFVTRIFQLGSPPKEYFDEVYHAFTAKVILHGDSKAWEWWNTPPEGFAYEWTHPPLAKLGMVAGMKIFGENSFGYRIPGALLGVGSVLLVYLIAKYLWADEVLALIASGVFSLDGLVLVMSRIGMNDSYILFFSLLTIYLFLKNKNFFAAIAYGLALSSKWSALWVIPILFLSHIVFKRHAVIQKKLNFSYLWFFVLPPAVYLATYIPMFLTGHGLDIWWGMQEQMWWYHTRLKATHPYTSPWWTWPFLVRPIYLYTSDEIGGWVSRIYAMGNPLVFWFGLVGVAISSVYAFFERNKKLAWVIFSYLVFFTPWALSPRIMFLYHYLPSTPFLAIATGYMLRRYPKLITYYLLLITLVFIYFYPHWAGLSVPLWLDKSYYWFSSWR